MASALINSGVRATGFGIVSYAFCRAFNQPSAFEKAALVTILVGLRELAEKAICYRYPQRTHYREFLLCSSRLVAIPCALYAGWMLNFKATDYLQIVGLTTIGNNISAGAWSLLYSFSPPPKQEK